MGPDEVPAAARHIGVIDVLVCVHPRHGPADTVTSTANLENIIRDALGLRPGLGFFLNVIRPALGTVVLGSNIDYDDRPDLYIRIDAPDDMTTYTEAQLWDSLAIAIQRWIPVGAHTIVARINNGRGVLFSRDSDHPRDTL